MGPPSRPYSTHHMKPLSQTKKSQLRNSRPLRSLPRLPSSPPQPQKALSSTEDPPPLYSEKSNPPSYHRIGLSTNHPLSLPIVRWTSTHTFLAPCPAPRTPTTTPTNTPSLFRTVRTFGLHKRSSPTKTSYVSSPTAKTSPRHSPTLSPLSGLKSFIQSLYCQQALFPPSFCVPKLGATRTPPPSLLVA